MLVLRVLTGALMALAVAAPATAARFDCPASLDLADDKLLNVPTPWELASTQPLAESRTRLAVETAGIYDGPPSDRALLRPAGIYRNGTVRIWKLVGPYAFGKWLSCDYYGSRAVTLVRRLPDGTQECRVRHVADDKSAPVQVECDTEDTLSNSARPKATRPGV